MLGMLDLKRVLHSREVIKVKRNSVDYFSLFGTYGVKGIKYPESGLLSSLLKDIVKKIKIEIYE